MSRSAGVVIREAVRTPIGSVGGGLKDSTVDELLTPLLGRLADSVPDLSRLREVVIGNVRGPGGNLARYALLSAGLPNSVPGLTLDRQCGAGLAAVEHGYYLLSARRGFVIAGGAQSASTQPLTYWPGEPSEPFERAPFAPSHLGDPDMGAAADLLAAECGITRERQDRYAARSHARAVESQQAGDFEKELVPVGSLTRDERPRQGFTPERLARFRPVFIAEGTLTAANSCGVNDGASALLLCDGQTHAELGGPGLRILGTATVGVDPNRPGWGVVPAVRAVLAELGLSVADFDAIEINEAFAGQVLACLDELKIDEQRNCPQGGALALGHAWASSGSVLLTRLFTQLVRQRRGSLGLAAIAIAGGMGTAMVVEIC